MLTTDTLRMMQNFEAFVVGHFRNHVADILMSCQAYMKGLQVGGNTEGCCSMEFRHKVEICMFQLIFRFVKIGAPEAYAFIPPRESTHADSDDEEDSDDVVNRLGCLFHCVLNR
ncbi:hypothetical protein Hdeb2414_s0018g00519671 [Helianthus debilis subsp. tardiflorus]